MACRAPGIAIVVAVAAVAAIGLPRACAQVAAPLQFGASLHERSKPFKDGYYTVDVPAGATKPQVSVVFDAETDDFMRLFRWSPEPPTALPMGGPGGSDGSPKAACAMSGADKTGPDAEPDAALYHCTLQAGASNWVWIDASAATASTSFVVTAGDADADAAEASAAAAGLLAVAAVAAAATVATRSCLANPATQGQALVRWHDWLQCGILAGAVLLAPAVLLIVGWASEGPPFGGSATASVGFVLLFAFSGCLGHTTVVVDGDARVVARVRRYWFVVESVTSVPFDEVRCLAMIGGVSEGPGGRGHSATAQMVLVRSDGSTLPLELGSVDVGMARRRARVRAANAVLAKVKGPGQVPDNADEPLSALPDAPDAAELGAGAGFGAGAAAGAATAAASAGGSASAAAEERGKV